MLVLICKKSRLLTLDELFTHLTCNSSHSRLGLHITLEEQTQSS